MHLWSSSVWLFPPAGSAKGMMADRPVTRRELMRGTGERSAPCLVAYDGTVYDVTDCPKWRTGFHEQLHFAGQDLTGEIVDAPHDVDVFRRPCVRRIGPLID
jgi:predicted heme/steroid binding protein